MSHVFNFDVPIHAEDYIHRIGRTGRAGNVGRAFTLAAPEDGRFVQAIETLLGKPIPPVEIPGIVTAALSYEEGAGRGRGRGRGRSPATRHTPPPPKAAPPAPQAARQPQPRHARPGDQPRQPESGPKPPQQPRQHQPRQNHQPTPQRFAPVTVDGMNRPAAPREEQRPAADDDRRIVGFGDDLPAFLARRS